MFHKREQLRRVEIYSKPTLVTKNNPVGLDGWFHLWVTMEDCTVKALVETEEGVMVYCDMSRVKFIDK